jgi:hypothetical protein
MQRYPPNPKKINTFEELLDNKWHEKNYFSYRCQKSKSDAKRRKIYFSLSPDYLMSIFPRDLICPASKLKFNFDNMDDIPSIDRIDNSKGYVEGNVIFVRRRVNMLKRDADSVLIMKIVNFYKNYMNAKG